jgi:hypothetical protein
MRRGSGAASMPRCATAIYRQLIHPSFAEQLSLQPDLYRTEQTNARELPVREAPEHQQEHGIDD